MEGKDNIQVRFENFHEQNPEVYNMIVTLTRQVKATGRYTRYGIDSIFSRLRWHYEFETVGETFKLNDHYRSRYARLIMEREPDLKGFFSIRELTAMRSA